MVRFFLLVLWSLPYFLVAGSMNGEYQIANPLPGKFPASFQAEYFDVRTPFINTSCMSLLSMAMAAALPKFIDAEVYWKLMGELPLPDDIVQVCIANIDGKTCHNQLL
jgi:hypothetical protein